MSVPKVSVITSLYRSENFLKDFFTHVSRVDNLRELELIIVHNDPTEAELSIIEELCPAELKLVHLRVPRENLYASWNRAVHAASGAYLTIWNVDDIRFPDSIRLQAEALDEHPEAMMAYGDMYGSNQYGVFGERLYTYPEYHENRSEFYRSYLTSCFQMYRKQLHAAIGYYDEQFRSSGDFDFQIRAAMHFPMVKIKGLLGVYLEHQSHKISSDTVQVLENNIVYLRYGVFEKIQYHKLRQSVMRYNKEKLLLDGCWVENRERSPFKLLYRVRGVFVGLFRTPYHMARSLKNKTIFL